MIPLSHILRKCAAGYKLSGLQEKINHLMYMDDIKLFAKNEKELESLLHTVKIYSQDIKMECTNRVPFKRTEMQNSETIQSLNPAPQHQV